MYIALYPSQGEILNMGNREVFLNGWAVRNLNRKGANTFIHL